MVAARDADFTGEGTADQGSAKPLTLAEQARLEDEKRKRKLEEEKAARLGRAGGFLGTRSPGSGASSFSASINPATGKPYDDEAKPGSGGAFGEWLSSVKPTVKAISRDPVTAGILLAPYGVVGAGAAIGGPQALGFGLGEGSIAGGSATPGMAFKDVVAPTITRTPSAMPAGVGAPGAASSATAPAAASSAPAAASSAWTWKDTVGVLSPLAVAGGKAGIESLIRSGGDDETAKLKAKQEQIARETELRRQQMQTARMDALGARMLAFDPYNQHLSRMFGPEAAFQPEQLAAMAENPMKPQLDPALQGYRGTDPKKQRQINDYMAAEEKYYADEKARRERVMGGVRPPGPGPAPLQQRTPLPARRF